MLILREKDLPREEYMKLARSVTEICRRFGTACVLHSFPDIAAELDCGAVHLPLHQLRLLTANERERFSVLGTSCHSTADAEEALRLGCTYIIAGHIFPTDCKKGLPPRGISFLKDVCGAVDIPVYAIGGITPQTAPLVKSAGAQGCCVMSSAMQCDDAEQLFGALTSH